MRVLLAAKHIPNGVRPIGGVQSWCRTVGEELRRRGHEVTLWEPRYPQPQERFDLGVIANPTYTAHVLAQCSRALTVCHGIIPDEQPSIGLSVFTSEEVRDHWHGTGPILRQPIDLEFWRPSSWVRRHLLRFSYRGGLEFVRELAAAMGLKYQHAANLSPVNARHAIRRAACVLATGRAALEAMACGVPVVLCDHRADYQGALLDPDTTGAMVRNYSGRGGVEPNPDNLRQAIDEATARGSLRDHVRQHHDAGVIVNQLLELAA